MNKTVTTAIVMLAGPVLGLFLLWYSRGDAGLGAWIPVSSVIAIMLAAIFVPAIGDIVAARRRMVFWSGIVIAIGGLSHSYIWFRITGDQLFPDQVDRTAWTAIYAFLIGISLAILPRSVAAWRRMTREHAETSPSRQILSLLGMTAPWIAIIVLAWLFGIRLDEPWPQYTSENEQASDGSYFPQSQPQSFVSCQPPSGRDAERLNEGMLPWAAENLRAAREPSLYQQSVKSSAGDLANSYRFTWLRSFHPVMTVRVDESGGKMVLTAKRLTGDGGHPSSKRIGRMVRRELTRAEGEKVRTLLNAAKPVRLECGIYADGAEWVVETRIGTSYHYAIQQSPDKGPVRKFGLYLLGLTGLRIDPVY